jgi:4-azaleucine resistance transporter AzlC
MGEREATRGQSRMTEQLPRAEDPAADGEDSDAPVTFTRAGIGQGLKTTIPLEIGGIVYGVIFGVVAANVGWSGGAAVVMSALVNSGAAQVAATDLWAVPPPMLTIWLTTALVSMRYLVLGASLRPWLSQLSQGRAYGSLFTLTDQSWALAFLEYRSGRRDAGFLLGSGLAFFGSWCIGTAVGITIGNVLPNPEVWSLDFMPTAIFVALVAGLWSGKGDAIPWLAAGIVSILVHNTLPGPWYVPLGAAAGLLAGLVAERWRHES